MRAEGASFCDKLTTFSPVKVGSSINFASLLYSDVLINWIPALVFVHCVINLIKLNIFSWNVFLSQIVSFLDFLGWSNQTMSVRTVQNLFL